MVPSISTAGSMNRLLPMISSTDPFLFSGSFSGPSHPIKSSKTEEDPYFSGLLSPSESIDWDAAHPMYDESFYDETRAPDLINDDVDTEFSFESDEEIENIFNSLEDFPDVSMLVDNAKLSDFVDEIQKDFASFVPGAEGFIELPDSPLSMNDSELDAGLKGIEESFTAESDTLFYLVPVEPEEEPEIEMELIKQEAQAEEMLLIEQPEVVVQKASRSGRVIKRKVYDDDDDDEDFEPVVKRPTKKAKAEPKSKPKSKSTPKRVRVYDEETKRQNMIAARRYRQKKKVVSDNLDDIYAVEVEKNDRLKKEFEQFQSEIKIMKELLASVLQPHSIVAVTSG